MNIVYPLVFAILLAAAPVEDQPAAPIDVGGNSFKFFAFDWDGKDKAGNTHVVAIEKIVFRYTSADPAAIADRRWVTVTQTAVIGENKISSRDALGSVKAGIYNVHVRFSDNAGQPSNYSEPLLIRVRTENPSTPLNLRVPE